MSLKKKKKVYDDDDGRTVANMNVEGMRGYDPKKEEEKEKRRKIKELKVSRKERRAMIIGAYLAYLPMFLTVLLSFTIVALLLWLW